jgi:predicted DCC family thiol-disulfide oxidoreductase YuxK
MILAAHKTECPGSEQPKGHVCGMRTSSAAPTTTVYYDGACPICSREIAQYRKVHGAERLDFVDAAACDANGLGPGLSRDAALARMHVR